MTRREKEALERAVNSGQYAGQDKTIRMELSCRNMIDSCLVYNIDFYANVPYMYVSYADRYIRVLGKKRVDELYTEEKADIARSTVINVDGTYKSIRWYDEAEDAV